MANKVNTIVGNESNPTKLEAGQTIINKVATKQNLDKLVEINGGKSNPKTTTDGTEGGLLKGKPHYDANGKPTGGIPAVVEGGNRVELEGEEFVVSKEASKKHWKELSKINTSAGNGVPINPPAGADEDIDTDEFEKGGKIEFNPNKLPNKNILKYAIKIKEKYPKVWDLGGNIFGNEAFKNLKRVSERGYWLDSEEWMYKKWRAFVSRHKGDFRIAGVIAMLKWVDEVGKGWSYMKDLIEAEIDKKYPKNKMSNGGGVDVNFYETTPKHAKQYGLSAKSPLFLELKSKKDLSIAEEYAKTNGNDVIFGHIAQKSFGVKDLLSKKGYVVNKQNNDFYKVISKGKMAGGGGVDNEFELTFWETTFSTDTDTEYLYDRGFDESEARWKFRMADEIGAEKGSVNLSKVVNTYKYVADTEEYPISDYLVEEYYDDSDFYELIDEGDPQTIDSKDVKSKSDIEFELSREFNERVRRYVEKELCVESKYGRETWKSFYGLKPYKDGFIIIRVADHYFSSGYVRLGERIVWQEGHSKELGKHEVRKNIYGYLSIAILDRESEKDKRDFVSDFNERYAEAKYKLVDQIEYTLHDYISDNEIDEDLDWKGDIDNKLADIEEQIDKALMDNAYENLESSELYEQGGSLLLAPNGKPSKLTPEQYKLVRTPEFKAWFGDWENDPANASKVVDENGEPLVVYRGFPKSKRLGNVFKPKNLFGTKGSSGRNTNTFGFYFTNLKEVAESYGQNLAEDIDDDFKVVSYFLNIRNLFNAFEFKNQTEISFKKLYELAKGGKDEVYLKNFKGELELDLKKRPIPVYNYGEFAGRYNFGEDEKTYTHFIDYRKNDGNQFFWRLYLQYYLNYDGLCFYEETHNYLLESEQNYEYKWKPKYGDEYSKTYCVFEPQNIKLADGSNTTFDANNLDIRYAGGGKVVTYRNKFNRKYGFDDNENHSLEEISKLTKLKLSALQEIYNKGIGAYKTNPESVRPNVKSKEQWAMARVYSAVMGGRASVIDKNELKRGKMEQGGNANSEKSALEQILEQVRPYQEKVVEKAVENAREKGQVVTEKDINLLKLELVADLYKSVGNYIENSDKVKDLTYNLSNNSIEVRCVIERDGIDYAFSTEVIVAGGYNIQKLHLRYIVKTKLPRKNSNPNFEAIKIKLSNLKKEDALLEQIATFEERKKLYESKIPQGSEKYLKMSDAEIEKISRADKNNELDWAYFDSTYQEHKERHPESNHLKEESFLFYQNTHRADHIERFRNKLSHRLDRLSVKNYEKEIEKLKGKLAKIKENKMEQGGELKKGITTEREHIKTLNELYAKSITPKVALKHIAMEHIAENPRYYSLLEGMKFEEGGNVTEAELMEMAKKFVNDLTPEQKAEITQKFQDVLQDELVSARKHLTYLDDTFKQNENRIKELREISHSEYIRANYDEREKLNKENSYLKLKITHAMNVIKVYQEGKFLINVTDERGVEHVGIPDFRDIDTSKITFDEETILDEPMPPYVPFINQSKFESKGFVFDAIRISKDTYIMAVNGYEENKSRTGYEHPSTDEQGYVVVTLDQLVLINDYYFTYKRGENIKKAKDDTARQERYYDSLPTERRAQYLNQRGFYNSLPVAVKKKISQADYEALDLAGKEALYKPFKRYNPKRIVSKLGENEMYTSFHSMYERFINPEAMPYNKTTGEKVPITGRRVGLYGDKEVFAYWHDFADMMKWKLKDIKVARETESEIRKLALETSFGFSNTNDSLEAKYGILVKRQDGSQILPNQIEQIREAWVNIQSKFGGLSTLAKEVKLKISHTGDKYVFSSKASGVYVPKMGTIAVTNKWGADSFQTIFAHETAHFIDNKIGEQKGQRFFSDNFEGKAGVIARTFRNLMNQKSESDYTNCTKECFARAMEQFFAIENFGYEIKLAHLGTYVTERDYVSKDNYDNQLRPLIIDFLQSEKDFFKYLVEIEEPQPTNIESGEQPIEPVAETKEEIKADEKAIDELQKEPLQETQKEVEQIKELESTPEPQLPTEITQPTEQQPIEQTMENKEEKGQETKPISSTNINNWDVVPSVWKNSKTIKKVTFVNSPYDKSLQTLIKPFLGTDTLRDQFMGINFDQYGITGTNAHILAHIPMPNKEFNGAYLTAVKGAKGDMFEGRYPDYLAVIPKDTQESYPFNAYKLLQYLNVARKFANNVTHAVALKISKDFNVGFNADFLAEILEFMLKLGHENLYIHASTPSRAFIISPDKNFSAENSLYGLIMPVMIDGYELGARDIDFNKELSVYFDFSKNAVINKDGSVAPFKMEYDYNALLPDNVIEVLNKYAMWGKSSKNRLPILQNFAVENGMGRVSDLESFYFFQAPNLGDGIYAIKDKAVQLQPDYKDVSDYPYLKDSGAENLFVMNADALKYYVEKVSEYQGTDEFRPAFMGTHFEYILGSEFNMVATNGSALICLNIANFVTLKEGTKPFNFTIETDNLNTFLNSLEIGEPIIVSVDGERIIFKSTTSKFTIRKIDERFPKYKDVIPPSMPVEMTIHSAELRECLKSKEVENFVKEHKKEIVPIFDKLGEIDGKKRAIYIGVNKNKTIEEVKRICSLEINEQEKQVETPSNVLLLMPVGDDMVDKFSVQVRLLKMALDTIPVETFHIGYRSKTSALVFDASKVSFAKTNVAKSNISKITPAKIKEVEANKPTPAPAPAPEEKKVSLEEYERLVTDELISLLGISNSDAQSILEVGNARLVVLRGYKDKESPLSIAKKVDALSKETAPAETKKEKLTFDDFHKGRPILIKIAGAKNFADKLGKVFSAFGVRDMGTNQPIIVNKNAYAYFIDKGKATPTRDAMSYENVKKAVNPREISLEELGITTETPTPAPAPKPAPTPKVETKAEETKAEETEKPKLEVLKARLNLLKKMIKAQPNNAILKTRIKIVSKMIEK